MNSSTKYWITIRSNHWQLLQLCLSRDKAANLALIAALILSSLCFCPSSKAEQNIQALINRKARTLKIFDQKGSVLLYCQVGIGKGGLGKKQNMSDCITPSGSFLVDIILFENPDFNEISAKLIRRYASQPQSSKYLASKDSLNRLFSNMNSLDFDGNGKPDTAYGIGYIGLDSNSKLSGPKLSKFKGTDYWFSIALHGTADEKSCIGSARSGGCIHLPEKTLRKIIENHYLPIGARVKID